MEIKGNSEFDLLVKSEIKKWYFEYLRILINARGAFKYTTYNFKIEKNLLHI
jgi:hypothetical protein